MNIGGPKMEPIASVGIPSDDVAALCEHQPDRPPFLIYGSDVDDGSNLFRKRAIIQRTVEDFRASENAGLASTFHHIYDLIGQVLITFFADRLDVDLPALLPIIRAWNADDLRFETIADQPSDRFEPPCSAVPNMST